MVPVSLARGTPCSSPATMKLARTGSTAPFIVIETDILSRGTPSKRIFMSSTQSIATATFGSGISIRSANETPAVFATDFSISNVG